MACGSRVRAASRSRGSRSVTSSANASRRSAITDSGSLARAARTAPPSDVDTVVPYPLVPRMQCLDRRKGGLEAAGLARDPEDASLAHDRTHPGRDAICPRRGDRTDVAVRLGALPGPLHSELTRLSRRQLEDPLAGALGAVVAGPDPVLTGEDPQLHGIRPE